MKQTLRADAATTALIYTRVSQDEMARDGLSLITQVTNCRRYAAQRQWIIGTEYQDILRGTRDDRLSTRAADRYPRTVRIRQTHPLDDLCDQDADIHHRGPFVRDLTVDVRELADTGYQPLQPIDVAPQHR